MLPSWLAVAGAWLVAFVACAWAGMRLPLPAGAERGRVRRTAWAAAWLGACCALPFVPLLFLPVRLWDESFPFLARPRNDDDWQTAMHPVAAVLAFLVLLRFCLSAVRLPGPWGGRDALPEVEEPGLRARVRELAEAMGVPLPRLLRLGSAGAMLETQAFAHGVVLPTLIVSDGILHRLDPGERDAVLAHELAHLARRSVPQMIWLATLAMTAGALASVWCPALAAAAWGLLVLAGVLRIHGHFDEVACDLRAARAVGFTRIAGALDKIHGSRLPDDDRWLSRWIHATQRHPSRTVRLWFLGRVAPGGEGPCPAVDEALVDRHRRTYLIAWFGWLAVTVGGLWWAMQPGSWLWALAFCLVLALAPMALLLAAFFRELVWSMQLGMLHIPWRNLLDTLSLIGALVFVFAFPDAPVLVRLGVLLVVIVLGLSIGFRRMLPAARRRKAIEVLFRRHDFTAFAEHVHDLPPRLRQEPVVRYLSAVARAARGEREEAVEELLALADDRPRMRAALLTASALLRPLDPQRSLATAERLAHALPSNPYALGRLAGARLRTGDLEGAREAAAAGLSASPRAGVLHALAARIAIRRGDMTSATDHIAQAEHWASGDLHVLLARAEYARAAGEDFEQACARLREACRHQPLAFADDEVEALCGATS